MFKEIGNWHHLDLKLGLGFFTYNKNGKTSCLLIAKNKLGAPIC